MDTHPDPRWQSALAHSRYLANLLATQPALIPELAAAWTAPLSADQLLAVANLPALSSAGASGWKFNWVPPIGAQGLS